MTPETIAVVNPHAAGGRTSQRWRRYAPVLETTLGRAALIEATTTSDAVARTRAALRAGARHVIAVGGDGTVNGVVNGFFDPESAEPISPSAVLAVLPVGTGNDFARSIGLHHTDLERAYGAASVRAIDVGVARVAQPDASRTLRVFVNTAGFGMGSRVAEAVSGRSKRFGGSVAYWVGTLRALLTDRAAPVRMRFDGEVLDATINTVAIGNGRYVGGGMKIAPDARLDDGWLDVVTIDAVGVGEFLRHSGRLYAGTHVALPFVAVRRARRFEAEALAPGGSQVLSDVEGEPCGVLPLSVEVRPAALRVLAPWGEAEAVSER